MNAKSGISSFSFSKPKYFCWRSFLLYGWFPGVLAFIILKRSSFLTPLGNENGSGCFHKTATNDDSFNKSYLYEFDTVPQLSHVYKAHFEGFITNLLLTNCVYHYRGSWTNQLRSPSSSLGYSLPSYRRPRLWQICMNLLPLNTYLNLWTLTYALTKPHIQSLVTIIEGNIFNWQKVYKHIVAKNTNWRVT